MATFHTVDHFKLKPWSSSIIRITITTMYSPLHNVWDQQFADKPICWITDIPLLLSLYFIYLPFLVGLKPFPCCIS